MKRAVVRVTVTDDATGTELHRSVAYAWNSAQRAAEGAVRTIALAEGQPYTRITSSRHGTVGTWQAWTWQGDYSSRVLVTRTEVMP